MIPPHPLTSLIAKWLLVRSGSVKDNPY